MRHGIDLAYSPSATRRPIIGILYLLNYIDRQNLAAAKLQGIMEDLNLTTQEFATAISILFGKFSMSVTTFLLTLTTVMSRSRSRLSALSDPLQLDHQ